MLWMNETFQSHMDLGHTVDSTGRYSSNHRPRVSFWSVVARTGGGAAGWEQVDAPAPQVPPEPPPGEKLLWARPGAQLALSATQRQRKGNVGYYKSESHVSSSSYIDISVSVFTFISTTDVNNGQGWRLDIPLKVLSVLKDNKTKA